MSVVYSADSPVKGALPQANQEPERSATPPPPETLTKPPKDALAELFPELAKWNSDPRYAKLAENPDGPEFARYAFEQNRELAFQKEARDEYFKETLGDCRSNPTTMRTALEQLASEGKEEAQGLLTKLEEALEQDKTQSNLFFFADFVRTHGYQIAGLLQETNQETGQPISQHRTLRV